MFGSTFVKPVALPLAVAGLLGLLAMTSQAQPEARDEAMYVGTLNNGMRIVLRVEFPGPGQYHVIGDSIGDTYIIRGGLLGGTESGKNFDIFKAGIAGAVGGGDAPSFENDGATMRGNLVIDGVAFSYTASRQ